MDIIELIKVIIIGIVEGITEWLPISSTGHMLLVDEFIHMNVTPEFREMFLYVIQLGAILAVIISRRYRIRMRSSSACFRLCRSFRAPRAAVLQS